jgi:hypothetical protein
MNFDFLQKFNTYRTIELLMIIRRPDDYQPAAVEAAQSILSTRNISPEEMAEADQKLFNLEMTEKLKQEKINAYKANVTSALSAIVIPDPELKPSKWLKILLILLVLQYIRLLYRSFPTLTWLLRCETCTLDIYWLLIISEFLYIPIILFLLLRRKKWGWILLFGESVFAAVLLIIQFYSRLGYLGQSIYQLDFLLFDPVTFIWPIIIRTLTLIFLLKKEITNYFNIERKAVERTIMVGVLLALSFQLLVKYVY